MFRRILIVFDNQNPCPESLHYARDFALRMDARVTVLMLVPMSFVGRIFLGSQRKALARIENRAEQILTRAIADFILQGTEVASALKVGEPSQELLKFLADRPPFQAIIWGSGPDLPGKGHWITRVSGNLECPLLTVSRKGAT
jgi:nucleotide-binding universal stress UspA family protein